MSKLDRLASYCAHDLMESDLPAARAFAARRPGQRWATTRMIPLAECSDPTGPAYHLAGGQMATPGSDPRVIAMGGVCPGSPVGSKRCGLVRGAGGLWALAVSDGLGCAAN